jgi:hypothetical protein
MLKHKKMRLNIPVLLILTFVVFISCNSGVPVQIDNPTDNSVSFFIDKEEIHVEPRSTLTIQIPSGRRKRIILDSGESEVFNVSANNRLLLNPTKSLYVLENIAYITEQMKKYGPRQTKNKITVGGYKLEGPYWLRDGDLVIDRWDYGPDETQETSMQERIKYSAGYEQREKVKIHREADFLRIVESEYRKAVKELIQKAMEEDDIKAILDINEEQFSRLR